MFFQKKDFQMEAKNISNAITKLYENHKKKFKENSRAFVSIIEFFERVNLHGKAEYNYSGGQTTYIRGSNKCDDKKSFMSCLKNFVLPIFILPNKKYPDYNDKIHTDIKNIFQQSIGKLDGNNYETKEKGIINEKTVSSEIKFSKTIHIQKALNEKHGDNLANKCLQSAQKLKKDCYDGDFFKSIPTSKEQKEVEKTIQTSNNEYDVPKNHL